MKKKIMAVTLCLAMVSTFAVGCGQKNETDSGKSEEKSSGKVEIEFVQVKREAAESYTKVIEAFEKENPDIVIKQNVVPDAQEVLMTRASSDSLPDMMNHWPTDAQFVQFEDEGLLLDLSEKDYMKNIDSKYLDAVKAKDGKNYIAPYNVNFMGVYYNKDKFEEAGYTMPTKWDELIALAEEIKAKGETPFILPNKDSWTVSNLWSNIEARDLGSHEDEFEKMKAGEESFETIPEYKSGVEKMIQLLDYANEDSLALGYDQAINDFANGEGWMFLQGSWTLPSFLSANPDFNVEFTILPNDNGKPIATQAVDTGFCVNAKVADEPEKMEAIDKFLSFALSAEGAQIYTDNDKSPCEGLLPLDGDVIIFVGIMDSDFRTESIEAFYVPKGTFVKLNPLIVHGTQYPVDKEDVHIVCMLPGRTFKNDMLSRRLETGEQIRITRGYKK